MQIRVLIFIFFWGSNYCFGQNYNDSLQLKEKLILTETQNTKWFDSLKILSTSQQLNLIIERLMLDSNVYVMQHGDRIKLNPKFQSSKFKGCCKPIIILGGNIMDFKFEDEITYIKAQKKIEKFKQIVNNIIIDNIEVLSKNVAEALFGRDGHDGVIVLNIKDRKSLQFIKEKYKASK